MPRKQFEKVEREFLVKRRHFTSSVWCPKTKITTTLDNCKNCPSHIGVSRNFVECTYPREKEGSENE